MQTLDDMMTAAAPTQMAMFGAVSRSYTPSGGDARDIDTLVDYPDDASSPIDGSRSRGPAVQITVLNDSTLGIAADEFTTADTIAIPPRIGASVRDFHLSKIIRQSEGLVTYEVH